MTATVDKLFGAQEEAEPTESLTFLAAQYLLLRKQVSDAQEVLDGMKQNADQAELALINAMEAQKMKSFRLVPCGTLLTSATRVMYALPKKDEPAQREEALAWLRRVGAKDLVKPDIHPMTLTPFLRERSEAGKPIKDIIKATSLRYVSVRAG